MKKAVKPSTLLSPIPAVLVCVGDEKKSNVITIAWTGIMNSEPPMTYVSIRPSRYSYELIKEGMDFTINLVPEYLTMTTDEIGMKSGRNVDKFKEFKLTKQRSEKVKACGIAECPVTLECKVKSVLPLGSHDAFIGEIVNVTVDENIIDEKGRISFKKARLVAYSHGEYYTLGKRLGKFGSSVKKGKK